MAEKSKPVARRRRATPKRAPKAAETMSPLEFLKSVYLEPIPDDADAATRARIVANKLAAARAAAALEAAGGETGEGELSKLLRELEDEANGDG